VAWSVWWIALVDSLQTEFVELILKQTAKSWNDRKNFSRQEQRSLLIVAVNVRQASNWDTFPFA
jgi:predicted nucleic acid-binding protein